MGQVALGATDPRTGSFLKEFALSGRNFLHDSIHLSYLGLLISVISPHWFYKMSEATGHGMMP